MTASGGALSCNFFLYQSAPIAPLLKIIGATKSENDHPIEANPSDEKCPTSFNVSEIAMFLEMETPNKEVNRIIVSKLHAIVIPFHIKTPKTLKIVCGGLKLMLSRARTPDIAENVRVNDRKITVDIHKAALRNSPEYLELTSDCFALIVLWKLIIFPDATGQFFGGCPFRSRVSSSFLDSSSFWQLNIQLFDE